MDNMNHFRVVNFDKTLSENEITIQKVNHDLGNIVLTCEDDTVIERQRSQPVITNDDNHIHRIKNKATKKNVNTAAQSIHFTSASEIFRNCKNSKFVRNISTNTRSFDDIRKRLKGNLSGTKIPNLLKKDQKRKRHGNRNQNMWDRNFEQDQDDIEVLYFNRPKHKMVKNYKPALSNIASSIQNSSSQIFSTGNPRINSYLCYQTCRNTGLLPTPKRRKKKADSNIYFLHKSHPLYMKKSKSKIKMNVSEHFNLVGFPICQTKVVHPSCSNNHSLWAHDRPDEQMHYPIDCQGDAGPNRVQMERMGPICPGTEIKNEKQACLNKTYSSESCRYDELKEQPVKRFFNIFKTCTAYFLTGLMIVVWLPCIIIGIIFLYIMSLFRPKEQEHTCPSAQKRKRSKIKFVIHWFKNACKCLALNVRDFMNTENITIIGPHARQESLPRIPCQVTAIRRKKQTGHNSKWQPNPDKRYLLYYSDSRGWLMKPQKKDTNIDDIDEDDIINKHCSHCDRGWEPRGRNKSVTFWDTQYSKPCQCVNKVDVEIQSDINVMDKKVAEVQANVVKKKVVKVQKKVVKPCPITPCPGQARNRKYQKDAIKKLNANKRSREKALKNRKVRRKAGRDCYAARPRNPNIVRYKNRCRRCTRARSFVSDPDICSKRFCRDGIIDPKKKSTGNKFRQCCADCWRDLKETVTAADKVWGDEIECGSLYLATLKRRPCYWIHRRWPNCYPCFLSWHSLCCNLCRFWMIFVACCVWCPLFFCMYITTKIICWSCN